MRRFVLALCAIALTGCGPVGTGNETTPDDLNLGGIVRALPTPAGFTQSSNAHPANTAEIQKIFAQGRSDAAAAANYESIGFVSGVARDWTGEDERSMVIVATRWEHHQTALNVGGGAAEQLPLSKGAIPWTPRALGGARGTRSADGQPPERTLSVTVGQVNLFIHLRGTDQERPVLRTMELAIAALRGA